VRKSDESAKGNGNLTLGRARELTPAVCPVEAMRRQLALAVFNSVKPQDVLDLANKLKEMAGGGDLKAMKLYFELVLGKEQKATSAPPAESAGLKMIGEAMRDLVDEIRVNRGLAAEKERELIDAK